MSKRGFACIGLHNAKTPANIGGAMRAAYCFNAAMVAVCGGRYRTHCTDTPKAWRHIPLLQVDDLHGIIPRDCVPVAVELLPEARPLRSYVHPERAFYVFGAEDATLGGTVLNWCRDVIYIPTQNCLNLAVCVSVVLYDRESKRTTENQ